VKEGGWGGEKRGGDDVCWKGDHAWRVVGNTGGKWGMTLGGTEGGNPVKMPKQRWKQELIAFRCEESCCWWALNLTLRGS